MYTYYDLIIELNKENLEIESLFITSSDTCHLPKALIKVKDKYHNVYIEALAVGGNLYEDLYDNVMKLKEGIA